MIRKWGTPKIPSNTPEQYQLDHALNANPTGGSASILDRRWYHHLGFLERRLDRE
jgi:hypothetical protein